MTDPLTLRLLLALLALEAAALFTPDPGAAMAAIGTVAIVGLMTAYIWTVTRP